MDDEQTTPERDPNVQDAYGLNLDTVEWWLADWAHQMWAHRAESAVGAHLRIASCHVRLARELLWEHELPPGTDEEG